jgi:hypothetical protein
MSGVWGSIVRTTGGTITFWSPGMTERYGFTPSEALGRNSSELLRTMLPHMPTGIEAELLALGVWTGGVINHHADGRAIMTAIRLSVHRGDGGETEFVTETHFDPTQSGPSMSRPLADLMRIIAREIIEPLTAIAAYNAGTRLTLEHGRPSREAIQEATDKAANQIARCAEAVQLLRRLADTLGQIDTKPTPTFGR